MGRLRPLSDAWLYWDAERLEGFPHSDSAHQDALPPEADLQRHDPRKTLRLRLLEDLLIYGAGIVSALLGMGLAVLLGSFIATYSALSEVNRSAGHANAVPGHAAYMDRRTLLADAATAAREMPVTVAVSESPRKALPPDEQPSAATASSGSGTAP